MEDGTLCLDDGSFCFTLDGAGGLVDSDGDALFRSSPPDTAEDSNGWEDPDDWEDPSGWEDPDIQQLGAGAEEFYGCWEYQYADEWLYVRDDGTYMWYDADGYSHEGSYTVSGETLLLDGDGLSYVVRDGGIVDDYGNLMFRSVLPDVDGTYGGRRAVPAKRHAVHAGRGERLHRERGRCDVPIPTAGQSAVKCEEGKG